MTQVYGAQPKNVIKGSCANAQAASQRGALDKGGNPSQDKRAGFTRPTAAYNASPYTFKKTEEGSWRCNQDNTVHKTRELCFLNCR